MSNLTEHKDEGHGQPHTVTVIVNGRPKEVAKADLTFAEVVALANLQGGPDTIFTVTYRKGEQNKEGSLVEGESVKAKEGMIFNVTATSKS